MEVSSPGPRVCQKPGSHQLAPAKVWKYQSAVDGKEAVPRLFVRVRGCWHSESKAERAVQYNAWSRDSQPSPAPLSNGGSW